MLLLGFMTTRMTAFKHWMELALVLYGTVIRLARLVAVSSSLAAFLNTSTVDWGLYLLD